MEKLIKTREISYKKYENIALRSKKHNMVRVKQSFNFITSLKFFYKEILNLEPSF